MKRLFKSAVAIVIVLALLGTIKYETNALSAWSKKLNGQYVNDKGKVIKNATMRGIDVSAWNGVINWKKVAKSDVDFAIIRCYDSKKIDDKYLERNIKGCEKYKIPYGIYLYSTATTTTQAMNEACNALRLCQGHTLKFPIFYDMEHFTQARLSKKKIAQIAETFLNIIDENGYDAGVYSNLNWWNNKHSKSVANNKKWFKWVAAYRSTCEYKGSYKMWQCTSTGHVKGISGYVDLNFCMGKYDPDKNESNQSFTTIIPDETKIKSTSRGSRKISLKWKSVKHAKGYRVQYSLSKGFTSYKAKTTVNKSLTIKGLKSNKTYYVRVKPFNIDSIGEKIYAQTFSDVASVKTR